MDRQFAEYSQNNAQPHLVAGYRPKIETKGSLDGALKQDTDAEFAYHLQNYQDQRNAGPTYVTRDHAQGFDQSK